MSLIETLGADPEPCSPCAVSFCQHLLVFILQFWFSFFSLLLFRNIQHTWISSCFRSTRVLAPTTSLRQRVSKQVSASPYLSFAGKLSDHIVVTMASAHGGRILCSLQTSGLQSSCFTWVTSLKRISTDWICDVFFLTHNTQLLATIIGLDFISTSTASATQAVCSAPTSPGVIILKSPGLGTVHFPNHCLCFLPVRWFRFSSLPPFLTHLISLTWIVEPVFTLSTYFHWQ